jgi:hypothetical protein
MTETNVERKARLLVELGLLLAPLKQVLFDDGVGSAPHKLHVAVSRFWTEYHYWRMRELEPFFTVDGALVKPLFDAAHNPIWVLVHKVLRSKIFNLDIARAAFLDAQRTATNALAAFPTEDPDVSVPRQSALEAYRRLRAYCATATSRVEVFDPYLGPSTFLRYLTEVRPDVQITVVSDESRLRPDPKQKRDVAIRDRLIALSELFAFDRPTSYRLLMPASIHDRHIRVDNTIFHVGGSLAHAAMHDDFSITETDGNASLQASLDGKISSSLSWYEPGMSKHRRWCAACAAIVDVKPNESCLTCSTPVPL